MFRAASSPSSPLDSWLLLFQKALGTDNLGIIEIHETEEAISFITTRADIADRLNIVLNTPKDLYASLRYTIQRETKVTNVSPGEAATNAGTVALISSQKLEINKLLGMGLDLIKQLFSQNLRVKLGEPWAEVMTMPGHNVLSFKVDPDTRDLALSQIEHYKRCLTKATLTDLRIALSLGENHNPLVKIPSLDTTPGLLAPIIDKLIYLTKDQKGNEICCFDIRLLCYGVIPPDLHAIAHPTQEPDAPAQYSIEFNKTHLISYLSTVIPEGFILHLQDHPHMPGYSLARPIVFNLSRAIPLELTLAFILDISGSMESCFNEYIAEVIGFARELKTTSESDPTFPRTNIRIRAFNNTLILPQKTGVTIMSTDSLIQTQMVLCSQ